MSKPDDYQQVQEEGHNWQWDRETLTRAQGMVTSLQKFVDIVTFVILKKSLDYRKGSAAKFQKCEMEVHEAYKIVDMISSIQHVRSTIDDIFINWYHECTELAHVVGSIEERPRTTKHQQHRSAVDAASTAEYYKTAFAILFLDHVLQNLRDRFSDENRAVVSVCSIIPAIVVSEQGLQGLAGKLKLYGPNLPLAASLVNEIRWRLF